MTTSTLSKSIYTLPEFSLGDLLNKKSLECTFNKLGTNYTPAKIAGKPYAVNQILLLHSDTELVILYRHSGRLIEKVFTDVDTCLEFAQNRFGVTL